MSLKRHHSVPILFLTSPRGRVRHVVFIYSSHRATYFKFTISQWLLSLRSVLSVCHTPINSPGAKIGAWKSLRVQSFMIDPQSVGVLKEIKLGCRDGNLGELFLFE